MMNKHDTQSNGHSSNNELSHKDCTRELMKLCHIKARDWLWPWDNDLVELPCGTLNCGLNKISEIDEFSSLYNDVVAFIKQHAVPLTVGAICLIGGTLYLWGLSGEARPKQTAPIPQESPIRSDIATDGLPLSGYVSAVDDLPNDRDDGDNAIFTPSLISPEHSDGEAAGQVEPFTFFEDD
jgi:hypothetical protein